MSGNYLPNPFTEELISNGVIVEHEHVEIREVIDDNGVKRKEIVRTIKYKDPRKFFKSYPDVTTKYLQLTEGSRFQILFILDAAIEKSINKDHVYLSHRDVCRICEERGIKKWSRSQLSKGIKLLLDNDIIRKIPDEVSVYYLNTKLLYNGMFARQLGLDNEKM